LKHWTFNGRNDIRFEKRLAELAAFKAKHGHCNVPTTSSSEYTSLGVWCSYMKVYYEKIKEGKTPPSPLLQDQIRKVEALGFECSR